MYSLVRVYNSLILLSLVAAQNCGHSGRVVSLVINGTEASKGYWPWLVTIHDSKTDQLLCGGTLIDDAKIITVSTALLIKLYICRSSAAVLLTEIDFFLLFFMALKAAHCIRDKGQIRERRPIDVVVKLGRYDLSQSYEQRGIIAHPLDITIHPNWNTSAQDYDSDIAVIKLSTPVAFNDVIHPICIWHGNEPPVVNSGYIVGYGKSENKTPHELIPRELDIQIITNEKCFLKSPRFSYISSENTFCAGKDEFSAPCRGDSGGGMYVEISGRWYLRGIVSASFFRRDFSCDTTADTLFTDVFKYLDWIKEKNTPAPRQMNHEIVCYVASWAMYRTNDGEFPIENIKPELCTTAIYHFAGLDDDGKLKALDPWADLSDNGGLNGYRRFTSLKKKNPQLRLLLAVGGWDEGVGKYSKMVANGTQRNRFAAHSVEFLKQYGFEGLNFFWDYPGDSSRGGTPQDKQNFPLLLREIYELYKKENLYLSVTLRSSKWITTQAYNIEVIEKYVDAINMMTFDYSGAWDRKIGFPAPLKADTQDDDIESAVDLFIKSKVPKNKIILGIPFYARTFTTTNDGNIGDETERYAFSGPIIESNVLVGFNELCQMRNQKSWLYRFDKNASQMTGKFIENGKVNVAIYDSPRAVANKVKYAMKAGLLGVFAWSIDTDDFRGKCPLDETTYSDFDDRKPKLPTTRDFPLLRTINEVVKFIRN